MASQRNSDRSSRRTAQRNKQNTNRLTAERQQRASAEMHARTLNEQRAHQRNMPQAPISQTYVYQNPVNQSVQRRQAQLRAARKRREEEKRRRTRKRIVIFLLILILVAGGILMFRNYRSSGKEEVLDNDNQTAILDEDEEEAAYSGDPIATISFVGDISVSEEQVSAATGSDGTIDFTEVFSQVATHLQESAFAVGNFESTIVDGMPCGGKPYYNAPIQLASALRTAGLRLVSTANTFALNNGVTGVISTKNYLESANLKSVGTYASQEERDENGGAYIREIHKIKFAFVSYTKGTDGVNMPSGCEYALNTLYTDYSDYWTELRKSQIRQDIQAARDAGAEVVVALIHWGSEYSRSISDPQKELADLLLNYGADVIIGTHSHLVGTMEFVPVTDSDGNERECFIAYSLGNFYTEPDEEHENARDSVILNLEFSRTKSGSVVITDAEYVPIYLLTAKEDGVRKDRVLDTYASLAKLSRVEEKSFAQATLYNRLLDSLDTLHNYAGAEFDAGPKPEDQYEISAILESGRISDSDLEELEEEEQKAREAAEEAKKIEEQEAAAQEAAAQTETQNGEAAEDSSIAGTGLPEDYYDGPEEGTASDVSEVTEAPVYDIF